MICPIFMPEVLKPDGYLKLVSPPSSLFTKFLRVARSSWSKDSFSAFKI